MTAGAPWSVKGIDPKAREIAKDLARRSGMTLGEWLNQVILEDEAPMEEHAPRYPAFGRHAAPSPRRYETYSRPVEDVLRTNDALDRLSARIEASEQRAAGAIGGIEQAVARLMARLDGAERDQNAAGSRLEGAFDSLRSEQSRVAERLRKVEQETAEARPGEVLKALEGELAKVAGQVQEGQDRAAETFDGLRQELDGVYERLEAAFTEESARQIVETLVARLSGRLEQAERRTTESLRGLESAFAALDERIKATEARIEDRGQETRLEALAADLAEQISAVRAEMAENIRASVSDGRFERMDEALQELTGHVRAAEQRSAGAIEKMGHQVLRMADTLSRSVQASEQRSSQAIEQVSERLGGEVARVAETFARNIEDVERRSTEAIERVGAAVEQRLTQADSVGAQALERLSGEIARITERLTERIANAERRSAQAIDDVGDQVARVSERLQERQERATGDLAERIRQSEERTARFLDEARERIDQRLAGTQRRLEDSAPPAEASEPVAFDAYADPAVAPFGDCSFAEPALTHPDAEAFGHAEPAGEADFDAPEMEDEFLAADPIADRELAEDDPFADAEGLIQPARGADDPDDFGAGLFTASEELPAIDADDDWISPALLDEDRERAADRFAAHDLEAAEPEALGDFAAERDDFAHDGAGAAQPFGLAALASSPAEAHRDPDADAGFEPVDEFVEVPPVRPRTTRELIEQARAAARSASPSHEPKAAGGRGGSLFNGFGLGSKKKRAGSTMRTALLVSGGTAAMGVALAGYVILADKPHGALPERVAEALGVHGARPTHPAAGEAASGPLAAVALSPKPIASQVAADQPASLPAAGGEGGAELYSDAVRRIEAKDKTGVGPLQKAANLGYAPAQFYLAKLYEDGQAGLPKDLVEARRWTERAAGGGDRKAMHNLALYFFEGVGGPKNLTSAGEWFRRAADLGLVDSQYNLARLYEEGFGVGQNPAEAYKWYLIAGRSGDGESRISALRIKSQLSAEAQSAAERAAQGFQPQTVQAAAAPAQAVGSDVATAQRALSRLGFYRGPADGAASPALKLAIAAYQRNSGLPVTGQLDETLNQRLSAVAQ